MSDTNDTGLERVPSGIAGLDTILSGGFFKGGLYIVEGAPGAGKTILQQIAREPKGPEARICPENNGL